MEFGASIFFTDYSITPAALAVALEERGFELAVGGRAFAYPGATQDPRSGRRRASQTLL